MQDLPIRNIFLPATLVGATVFSALTFAAPTIFGQRSQGPAAGVLSMNPMVAHKNLETIHKDLAISYIGTTIVLSTVTGIGTAELLRKRKDKDNKQTSTTLKSVLAEFIDNHAHNEAHDDVEEEFANLLADMPAVASALQAPVSEADEVNETDAAASDYSSEFSFSFPRELAEAAWPSSSVLEAEAALSSQEMDADADNTVIFPGQYQRCRIQVQGLPAQLYAIEFNEKFYSLLNSGVSKEQAIAAVKQLEQENRTAILTGMNQGYAVWVLEANAKLVATA